jgi:molybdenum cofactor synthesis domain-containing protein
MQLDIKKSGIIIIGNEILSGKTIDSNSNFLCKTLSKKGIIVREISVIPDNQKDIINKVNNFRKKYDYVFTTGGIGPTHDDITSESVAKAFKLKLELNFEANKILKKHYSDEPYTKARQKMAYLPKTAKLIHNPVSIAPGFFVENVFVLPGVPRILEIMTLELLKKIDSGDKILQRTLTTTLSEGIIGDFIGKIQKKNPKLEIGSYPYFKKNAFGVSIVIRGYDKKNIEEVSKKIFDHTQKKGGNPKLF